MAALTSTTRLDLAVKRGDDFRLEFDLTIAGALQTLATGWTGEFKIVDRILTVRATGSITFADPLSAAVLTAAQTTALAPGDYTYFIRVAKASLSLDRTIFEGIFTVAAAGDLAISGRGRC